MEQREASSSQRSLPPWVLHFLDPAERTHGGKLRGLDRASLEISPHFDRPLDTVADRYFGAGRIGTTPQGADEIAEFFAVGGDVVGDDRTADADMGPDQIEVGAAGRL